MKRITGMLLTLMLCFGGAGGALADGVDIKVKGQWDFAFGWASNGLFVDSGYSDAPNGFLRGNTRRNEQKDDNFIARQRIRTQLDFSVSEALSATLMFEIGDINWGRGGSVGSGSGGGLDTDGVNIETKRAYLDWVVPNTDISVRMGLQGIKLPSTPMGSPLFDADAAAVMVSTPVTDWLAMAAVWMRPFDQYRNDKDADDIFGGKRLSDEVDAFGLLLPMHGDGWAVTPWGVYSFVGSASGIYDYLFAVRDIAENSTINHSRTQAFWLGLHTELSILDPLVFNFEAIYGHLKPVDLTGFGHGTLFPNGLQKDGLGGNGLNRALGSSGWFLAATLDYKMDWGTPGVFGWWASGDKHNSDQTGKYGRLPILGNDGGSFKPTSFGMSGTHGVGSDTIISGSGAGTWGVGLQFADVSFIEDLSHTLRVAYYQGTNNSDLVRRGGITSRYSCDPVYLTTKDSVIEVNFDHKYKIYDNLTAVLELGYLRLKADRDTWATNRSRYGGSGKKSSDNAWKAELNFQYKF